jgi:hypothetical protein
LRRNNGQRKPEIFKNVVLLSLQPGPDPNIVCSSWTSVQAPARANLYFPSLPISLEFNLKHTLCFPSSAPTAAPFPPPIKPVSWLTTLMLFGEDYNKLYLSLAIVHCSKLSITNETYWNINPKTLRI